MNLAFNLNLASRTTFLGFVPRVFFILTRLYETARCPDAPISRLPFGCTNLRFLSLLPAAPLDWYAA
jgi:hypothetical protein